MHVYRMLAPHEWNVELNMEFSKDLTIYCLLYLGAMFQFIYRNGTMHVCIESRISFYNKLNSTC